MLGLVDGQFIGQNAADLSEFGQSEPVALQFAAHGLQSGVRELGFAVEIEHGRSLSQSEEEEAERVDAVDHARHVLPFVDVRRLRVEDGRQAQVAHRSQPIHFKQFFLLDLFFFFLILLIFFIKFFFIYSFFLILFNFVKLKLIFI